MEYLLKVYTKYYIYKANKRWLLVLKIPLFIYYDSSDHIILFKIFESCCYRVMDQVINFERYSTFGAHRYSKKVNLNSDISTYV